MTSKYISITTEKIFGGSTILRPNRSDRDLSGICYFILFNVSDFEPGIMYFPDGLEYRLKLI